MSRGYILRSRYTCLLLAHACMHAVHYCIPCFLTVALCGTHSSGHAPNSACSARTQDKKLSIYMNMHAHTHRCHRDDTCMRNTRIVWMWWRHSTSVVDRCQQVLPAALLCCMYARMRCAALRPYRCGRCEDVEVRLAHHSTAATATKLASKYHCHYIVHD